MYQIHNLLQRQLKKYFGDSFQVPSEWQELVNAVNDAYMQSDVDRGMLERSLDLSSQELLHANSEMRALISLLSATIESTADGILVVNREGKIVSFNQKFVEMWHIPQEIIESRDDDQALSFVLDQLKDPEVFLKKVRELYAAPEDKSYDELIFKDGRVFERYSQPQQIEEKVIGRVWSFSDITERKRAEESLAKEKVFSDSIINALPGIFYLFNENGQMMRWNRNLEIVTGYSDKEIAKIIPLDFFAGEEKKLAEDAIKEVFSKGESSIELNLVLKDGRRIPYFLTGLRLISDNQNYLIGVGIDISERKRAEDKIEYLAYYDALTGLPNRRLFIDRLSQGIARAVYSKKIVAVLVIDIDRFKFINDTYGLHAGDTVLKEISARLSNSLREGDTVARIGGDDFGVLLIDVAQSEDVVLVLEKITKNLSPLIHIDGKEIMATLSIGISVYPTDGNDAAALIKNADLALFKAKQQGRKNYQFFAEGMDVKASEFVLMEKHLFNALENKEFLLYYQPYYEIYTKKLIGIEALVRWKSPEFGMISPGTFIPILEDTGMIIEVGEWILRTAIRQVKEWQDKRYLVVPISVNLSSIQFRQKDFHKKVDGVIREHGFYPSLLTLEITESAFMQDIKIAHSVLRQLKDIGVSISIDDFGTGYSSLAYLKRFPIDNLKIDISFIREMVNDPDSASIVMAIIAMAHTLNLKTIAEGIETEEQWKFLRLLRSDMGQGYYFSKPLPAEEIEKLFI